MKPILSKEKRQKITIEETISNSLYLLVDSFNLGRDNSTYKEIKNKAKTQLSDKHYEVFLDLYISKIKKNVKAIRIVRKLKNEKDYDKKFAILIEHVSSMEKITHTIKYLNLLMADTGSEISESSIGYYQSWCIEYVYNLLQD